MTWLTCLRRYLLFLAGGNLVWEGLHMPLYTLWVEGTNREIILYGLHCFAGDMLIGLSAIALSLLLLGSSGWPRDGYVKVAGWAMLFGVAYTAWSEWYNVEVLASWAYSDLMPVEPFLGIGLSPLAQWIAIPAAAFWWARRVGQREPNLAHPS